MSELFVMFMLALPFCFALAPMPGRHTTVVLSETGEIKEIIGGA